LCSKGIVAGVAEYILEIGVLNTFFLEKKKEVR